MIDIKAILKQAKRRQVTVEVCLRGDLAGEYEALDKKLAELPASNKLAGDPERQSLQAEMERLRHEMQDGTVPFVLRALSDADFQQLIDAHPPRRDGDDVNEQDARIGYNPSTFSRALIRACVVEPTLDDEDWDLIFAEALSPAQVLKLGSEAARINGQDVDVPFSLNGSNGNPD